MNLSAEEIEAMLAEHAEGGAANIESGEQADGLGSGEWAITPEEADILGEVGNMCMGAVATAMYTLLDRPVSITTPRVSVHSAQEVISMYAVPFVVVEVEYTEGIDGKNILMLKEPDAALITDVLMGGDGSVSEPIELSELHMSAISEVMNQMIGASATAMSKVIGRAVNISPPVSNRVEKNGELGGIFDNFENVIVIRFDMVIEGLLQSQLFQLMPFAVGRDLASALKNAEEEARPAAAESYLESDAVIDTAARSTEAAIRSGAARPSAPPPAPPPAQTQPQRNLVDVRPMQFSSFDTPAAGAQHTADMNLISDIPLQVSVELGRTKKEISEILEFGIGTVVVLDKLAGDPVEVLVNGKVIARGEVVVIDDNYGIRLLEITGNR